MNSGQEKEECTNRNEVAIKSFQDGLNCAQSVLTSFKDEINLSESDLLKISAGFGGGIGKLQKTCGAVTGAVIAIGMIDENLVATNRDSRDKLNHKIQEFNSQFKKIHKTSECRTLLGIDLISDDGAGQFEDQGLGELVCEKCIADSVNIVESIMQLKPSI